MKRGTLPGPLAADVAAVQRIDAVPTLLRIVCDVTGMGFAVVARVTDTEWVACAVEDRIDYGLRPGMSQDLNITLCKESREKREPIVFDQASNDPLYRHHAAPKLHGIESYVSMPVVLPDGEYFGNLCAVDPSPRNVANAHVLKMFAMFAELLAVQLAVERSRDRALEALMGERAASGLREEFVAVLGHDLREPVEAIARSSRELQSRSRDPEVVLTTARIAGYTRRVLGLVDNLRDLAQSRLGGGLDIAIQPIDDFDQALQETLAQVRSTFAGRVIEFSGTVGRTVRGDRARLRQVVSNLLVNALTHGAHDGTVELTVGVPGDAVELVVSNRGAIPPEDLPRLLEPFWRKSGLPRREGVGLGLYICDQIVRAHHGAIRVRSDANFRDRIYRAIAGDAHFEPALGRLTKATI